MKLKYIELTGFKTFPDKLRIQFNEKVNIIVGPNGCGKSNIVDAMRFILGEQNLRELRLKNMNELIFNGSGSKGMAMAAVGRGVFINNGEIDFKYKDFSEISVERRYFRDGENEYRINGTIVPYREYAGFFMESGISYRFYSIIDHGKISSILNYKPEEMRLLFEEAAGITRYRHQKKAALRRLEGANANLLRINDIYSEVEKQEKALKSQFEALERYKKLFEEKRKLEFVLFDRSRNKILSIVSENKKRTGLIETAAGNYDKEIVSNENASITCKSLFQELNECFRSATDEKNRLIVEITRENSDIKYNIERSQTLNSELAKMRTELKENEALKIQSEACLKELKGKENEVEESVKKFKGKLSEVTEEILRTKQEIDERKEKLGLLRDEILELTEKSQFLNNKVIFNGKNIQDLTSRINAITDEIQKIKEDIISDENILESKKDLVTKLDAELNELKNLSGSENENFIVISDELDKLKFLKGSVEKDIFELRSKISRLSELIDHHEGFSEGPRRLLEKKEEFGIISSFGDIIESESGFENIVWNAFSDILETVIVNDVGSAAKALSYLNSNKFGQAKIFIPGKSSAETSLINDKSLEGLNLVPLKEKILFCLQKGIEENIIRDVSVLAGFFYIESAEDILVYIKENRSFPVVNIISNDGTVFLKEGIIIGGKRKNDGNENLFINKKKLLDSKKILEDKDFELKSIADNILIKEKALEEQKKKLDSLGNAINSKEMTKRVSVNDLDHISKKVARTKERLAVLNKEKDNLAADKEGFIKEKNSHDRELEVLKKTHGIKTKDKESLEIEQNINEDEFEKIKEKEVKLRIELSSAENNFGFLGKDIENTEHALTSMIAKLSSINSEIERIKNEIVKLNDKTLQKRASLLELNESFRNKETEIKELEDRLRTLKLDEDKIAQALNKLKKEKNELEKKKDKVLIETGMLEDRLNELNIYDFSAEEIEKYSSIVKKGGFEKTAESSLKSRIENIKMDMENAGNINMNAAEEYNETLSRLNFLASQRDDLNASIRSIEDIIKKLDRICREKFNADLSEIRTKFNDLFSFLFGGGHADILNVKQEDRTEEDALGIEINVQIPGKRSSGINLLSEGEKVMIAISLIFAIFLVKRTPFCVIDEVDAPLDDANNARYNKLIKEISNLSQVVMVTHNKKTMELGDYIFGITTKEPGISKVVSVVIN